TRLPVFPMTRKLLQTDGASGGAANEPIAYGALHQRMVEQYAAPSALISPDDKLVHLSQHAGKYMLMPAGEPTANIYKLICEDLRIELRAALHTARSTGKPLRSNPLPVHINGEQSRVVLHVRPSLDLNQAGYALVIFDDFDDEVDGEEPPKSPRK